VVAHVASPVVAAPTGLVSWLLLPSLLIQWLLLPSLLIQWLLLPLLLFCGCVFY
jgi:hypothetical protein